MSSNHITDEMLQAFLLEEQEDAAIAQHLETCTTCTARLQEYQQLIAGIENMPSEAFSFDVTALTMNAVNQYEIKRRKKRDIVFWSGIGALVIAFAIICLPFIPSIGSLFAGNSLITIALMIGTGIAVLSYLLVDVVRQHKIKENKIFNRQLQPTR